MINEEVKKSLSAFEMRLCRSFKRIEIRGKRERTVPMLLTSLTIKAMELLVETREAVGVDKDNPHLFAVPTSKRLNAIRGSDALRNAVKSCGLSLPEAFTSTNLRKHIATLCQLFDLKESDLEILAIFLGHDLKIHKQYYRMPEETTQLAKVSKILMMMQDSPGKFYGKSLDEVELHDDGMIID